MTSVSPAPSLNATIVCHNFPASLPAHELRTCWLMLENSGTRSWDPERSRIAVDIDGHRYTEIGLPHAVAPAERVSVHWVFRTIDVIGRHEYSFQLIDQDADASHSAAVASMPIEILEPLGSRTSRLRDRVLETHARCWLPCDGITWGTVDLAIPHFAREARGCRITDVEGRQFVDYLMGWGSALLGYADDRIQRAVEDALRSGAVLTLTHHLMPEVADLLCEMFAGAEAVTFGKNGSDVCTAAVRLARAHTGRPIVLVCGYHGWQDWYVERVGFSTTGVPERSDPAVEQFAPNNLDDLGRLLARHRGQVAGVMLEPAGVIESYAGPARDANPAFLAEMIAMAHREGALVIFDEILTGFRYRKGSVQAAARVVPDLTCLGKALSPGMPLSALIGRRDIFNSSIGRIAYEPTFKGEVYSLAAAWAALNIYRSEDVPLRIWNVGSRLRDIANQACRRLGIAAEMIGPPFRMLLAFAEPDSRRRTLMRTLFQQELFRMGVLTTQNLFLPSTAHDEDALRTTERAFDHALKVLADAMRDDRFAAYLEIPPLPS
jgi:glutamate-1-semialdehyde aminotransferase